ncbi:hypothetical protein [Streptomyces spiramenti]|uniref:Septum formation-related domain-containing protein n=1 Tax=Streptomyces spiramenti TaxID=2720606 RepID=A0ABX1AQ29_9ACTN|nr:hypothetical protein [Streptomyces spiramenti]NJP67731.1 hypothetical protein [Streptomyces spiramenti]
MRTITARTAHRRALTAAAGAVILTVTLTACSGDSDDSAGRSDVPPGLEHLEDLENIDPDDMAALEDALNELEGLGAGTDLSQGDCWGRADTVDHSPTSCTEPHIFEVTGVHTDFEPSAPDDIITTTEEKEALCEETFAEYFGFPVNGQQPPVLVPAAEPTIVTRGIPQTVVCSAYTTRTEEHTASFR